MRIILWRNFFLRVGYRRRCLPKINVELFFVIFAHPGFGIYDGSQASQVWSPCAVLGVATGPPIGKGGPQHWFDETF